MRWKRRRPQADFAREIQAHRDLETERLVADSVDPEEARFAARRTFGNVAAAEERFYESGRLLWLDHLLQDVRYAARSIARYPVACSVAMISLAASIPPSCFARRDWSISYNPSKARRGTIRS